MSNIESKQSPLMSPEQQAAKEGMIETLSRGNIYNALEIKNELNLSDEIFQSPEIQEAAKQTMIEKLSRGNIYNALEIKNKFNFPNEIIQSPEIQQAAKEGMIEALSRGDIDAALKIKNELNLPNEIIQQAAKQTMIEALSERNINIALNIQTVLNLPERILKSIDQDFAWGYQVFGLLLNQEIYETIKKIREGNLTPQEIKQLGINKDGETGLNQLRLRLNKFKSEILEESFDPEEILDNKVLKAYFKAYTRFESSEWGEHNDYFFDKIINSYLDSKGKGAIAPLPEEYAPSQEILIDKIDRQLQEEFKYSEQFLSRYNTLRLSLKESISLFKKENPLSFLAEQVEERKQKVLAELYEKRQKTDNPKAIENLEKRIKELETLKIRNIKQFQDNFALLAQHSPFHEQLCQLVFYFALHKHKNYREWAENISYKERPSFDDVSAMVNFTSHIVNQETWQNYFTNKSAVKAFGNLINIRALEEELARIQDQKTKGTSSFVFVPTRGLLLEFSGHIADACWASRYESIGSWFPHFSSVIMVQNKGTVHERLAGACLLIEAQAQDGTPLLIIRGLNPIENVINTLSVQDFYEKFTAYLQTIAQKRKRKLAIVIDDHSGGSGTNRPVLFQYLSRLSASLENKKLANEPETYFNGYDITDDTYILM